MSVRQLCNVIYAMHAEGLDTEGKAEFDRSLNDESNGDDRKAERRQRMAQAGMNAIHIAG